MHRLLLSASGASFKGLATDDLLWRPHGEPSSFTTTLGPRLEGLGDVPDLNVDFVRLAALVFFCDRTVTRPPMQRRTLELSVAVSDPAAWTPHSDRLSALLGILTGDSWMLSWARRREPRRRALATAPNADLALLFSGGADSTCGAVVADGQGRRPVLVSHFDWRNIGGQQVKALDALERATGTRPERIRWRFAREAHQVGSGVEFANETSKRSRSLLFLALGLAVSATTDSELWVAENGFTSLNPPLMGESLGALSTRTTHPSVIQGLRQTLEDVGMRASVSNVFADLTKGQVFTRVKEALGADEASRLLSSTHSCGKPQRIRDFAPDAQCGVCLGCLVRRGAFIASEISDRTEYLEQQLGPAARARWLSAERRSTYQALQDRLAVGFSEDDVLDLGLADDADLDRALGIVQEGLHELESVLVP